MVSEKRWKSETEIQVKTKKIFTLLIKNRIKVAFKGVNFFFVFTYFSGSDFNLPHAPPRLRSGEGPAKDYLNLLSEISNYCCPDKILYLSCFIFYLFIRVAC